jgi:hypothetical protein
MTATVTIPDEVATSLKDCKAGSTIEITMKLDGYSEDSLEGTAISAEPAEPDDSAPESKPMAKGKMKMPPVVADEMGM